MIDVSKPNMAMVGLSAAILPTAFTKDEEGNDLVKDWRTIALVHMTQFSNPGERANGKGRKRE